LGSTQPFFTRGRGGGNIGIGFAILVDQIPPFLQAVTDGTAPTEAPSAQPMMFSQQDAEPIELNGPAVEGNLDNKDNILPVDNSYYDIYAFEGTAGQQVTIEMTSSEIDPYLILLNADGSELAQDDDSGGDKNAKITVTLPTDGTYTFLANSYEAGQSGNYQLKVVTTVPSLPSLLPSSQTLLDELGVLENHRCGFCPLTTVCMMNIPLRGLKVNPSPFGLKAKSLILMWPSSTLKVSY
jgi:hypothetical protein